MSVWQPAAPNWIECFWQELRMATAAQTDALPVLSPCQDLSKGDFSSDIAIRTASCQRRSPDEIAKSIVSQISEPFQKSCQIERGYINVTIPKAELWQCDVLKTSGMMPVATVLVPESDEQQETSGYYLVLAAAVLQCSCAASAGVEITFQVGGQCIETHSCETMLSPGELFISALEAGYVPERDSRGGVVDLLRGAVHEERYLAEAILWANTRLMTPLLKEVVNSASSPARIKYPDVAGGFECDQIPELKELKGWRDSEISSLVLGLLRSVENQQFDFRSCQFEERLNLVWFVRSLQKRLSRYKNLYLRRDDEVRLEEGGAEYRELLVRLVLFELAVARAIDCGSVVELVSQTVALTDGLSAFLNNPRLRMRLDQKRIYEAEAILLNLADQRLQLIDNLISGRSFCQG